MRLNGPSLSISLVALCATTVPVHLNAETIDKPIHVPAQPLDEAIAELGNETGLQIVARGEDTAGRMSAPVSGPMTPLQALGALLGGTGLAFQEVGAGSVIVSQNTIDSDTVDLGSIVVQGENVERDVFSTTSSVRVFDGEELEREVQSNDVERVIGSAANVTTLGTSNNTPVIRGQISGGAVGGAGAALSGQLPRANITVDGRVQTFNELAYSPTSIWDTEAIEVFRGPQTTSQGANAIAGAINIRTRDPVFQQEAAIRGEIGDEDGLAGSLMVNTPLSDSVALRFTLDYQEEDNFINYEPDINSASDADQFRQFTGRLKLLWEPVEVPELSSKLTFSYTDFNSPQALNVVEPFEDLVSNATNGFPSAFNGDNLAIIHDLEYELGGGFFVRNQLQYSDGESARTTGNPTEEYLVFETTEWANELIFDFVPDSRPLTGLVGFYARQTETDSPDDVFFFEDEKLGWGLFGEATYRFANNFDVTGGLRYQRDRQERRLRADLVPGIFPPVELDFDETFDAWLPKIALGYEPNEDARFSVQLSRGFNPGGASGSFQAALLGSPDPFFIFDEEKVTTLEFAMRRRFLDGRMFVAANVFYNEFDDYQVATPRVVAGFVDTAIVNAEDVETYGAEVDVSYLATDRLTMNGSLGLLKTEVKQINDAATDVEGNELPFAPDVTLALGLDYALGERWSVGGQVRYSAGYFSNLDNDEELEVDSFATVDLRASYALNDRAEFYGYVNNVFDEIEPVSIAGTPGSLIAVTTRPREFGIGIRMNF